MVFQRPQTGRLVLLIKNARYSAEAGTSTGVLVRDARRDPANQESGSGPKKHGETQI